MFVFYFKVIVSVSEHSCWCFRPLIVENRANSSSDANLSYCRLTHLTILCTVFNGYFALREWNFDAVAVERFVDALHYCAVVARLCEHVHPHKYFEGYAAVVETPQHYFRLLTLIDESEPGN